MPDLNRSPRLVGTLVFLLLFGFFVRGAYLIRTTSPTTDEVAFHAVNGYTYLVERDFRMNPSSPALIREWMALPWLFLKPTLNISVVAWEAADSVPFAKDFFYRDNRAMAQTLLDTARGMILLLGIALGYLVFRWSRRLYGPGGGLVSLCFYAGLPTLAGHAALATTDVGTAFLVTLSGYFLWRYLETPGTTLLWFFAACAGATCAAKYNAIFFLGVFLTVLWIRKGFAHFLKALAAAWLSGFFIVWAVYFFEWQPLLWEGVPRTAEKLQWIEQHGGLWRDPLKHFALNVSVPFPSYLRGLLGILKHHSAPYYHYAFGKWTLESHWYHYLFLFFVKMTPAFLLALALRIVALRRAASPSRHENWLIGIPVLFYLAALCFEKTAHGIRYLMPVFPLLCVWLGGVVRWTGSRNRRLGHGVIAGLLAAHFFSAASSFPYYLSYFNFFIGGSANGYRYVRDSDVDWGQGLRWLKTYIEQKKLPAVKLVYFGTADPSFYDIPTEPMQPSDWKQPSPGIYVVSAQRLEDVPWTNARQPTATIGHCLHVYDFRR